MCPRPRKIDHAQLVEAAARVTTRLGADVVRLADVATESGLAAATLVQRFGSRDALLEAVAKHYVGSIAQAFRITEATELRRLGVALTMLEARTHLTFFAARPTVAPAYELELRKHVAFALVAAVQQGELPHCDVATLARRIQIGYLGLVTLALLTGEPLNGDAVRTLVTEVLADYS
jgi:AcrR family transcriptional regulator